MSQKLRIIIPLALLGAAGVAYAAHVSAGTLSAFGWESISLICPIGALGTMLASKMLVPRAVISIVLAVAAILLLGRAFCGWLCPVPVWSKLRGIFKKGGGEAAPPSGAEKRALKTSCAGACSSCADRKPADSRHIIMGGTLLSAAIFGFPVFCLVCPVGLTFATVLLVMRLFAFGETTWTIIAFIALIAAEVILLPRWCAKFCPLGALLSLMSGLNRTFRPHLNAEKCLAESRGASCDLCVRACPEGINLHDIAAGETMLADCSKCRACADVCPEHAITFPLLAPKPAHVRAGASAPDAMGDLDENLAFAGGLEEKE